MLVVSDLRKKETYHLISTENVQIKTYNIFPIKSETFLKNSTQCAKALMKLVALEIATILLGNNLASDLNFLCLEILPLITYIKENNPKYE